MMAPTVIINMLTTMPMGLPAFLSCGPHRSAAAQFLLTLGEPNGLLLRPASHHHEQDDDGEDQHDGSQSDVHGFSFLLCRGLRWLGARKDSCRSAGVVMARSSRPARARGRARRTSELG